MITIEQFIKQNKNCIKDGWVFCTEMGEWFWTNDKPSSYWILGSNSLRAFDIAPKKVLKKHTRQYKSLVSVEKIIQKIEVKQARKRKILNFFKSFF